MKLVCGELRMTFDEPVPPDALPSEFTFAVSPDVEADAVGSYVDHNDPYSIVLPFRVRD